MASKGAMGVIVIIIAATAMGIGAFIGGEFAGDIDEQPTDSPTATGGAHGSVTPTRSQTASSQPTVAPAEFDPATIEHLVAVRVNAERADHGLDELQNFDRLAEMAIFHSENMAAQQYASHAARGYDTLERYEQYDLDDRCRVRDDSSTGIRDGRSLETVAKTLAGRPFERNGNEYFHRTDEEVARAVVNRWEADPNEREKLMLQEATRIGVGVIVADDGGTYVTVDLC